MCSAQIVLGELTAYAPLVVFKRAYFLLATSEAELQELVDRLDRVSRKYSLLINIDKTKVMASDGIRAAYSFRMNYWSRWIRSRTLGP